MNYIGDSNFVESEDYGVLDFVNDNYIEDIKDFVISKANVFLSNHNKTKMDDVNLKNFYSLLENLYFDILDNELYAYLEDMGVFNSKGIGTIITKYINDENFFKDFMYNMYVTTNELNIGEVKEVENIVNHTMSGIAITKLSYDKSKKTLEIIFKDDTSILYYGIEKEIFEDFCGSDYADLYFTEKIFKKYHSDQVTYIYDKCDVNSSAIKTVQYDHSEKELTVTFKNDTEYIYYEVGYITYLELVNNESVGKYYNSNVKGLYQSNVTDEIERVDVDSDILSNLEFVNQENALSIEFKNGTVVHYIDVPREIFVNLKKTSNKGHYFNKYINHVFSFEVEHEGNKEEVLKNAKLIQGISYEALTNTLKVKIITGAIYVITNIDTEEYEDFLTYVSPDSVFVNKYREDKYLLSEGDSTGDIQMETNLFDTISYYEGEQKLRIDAKDKVLIYENISLDLFERFMISDDPEDFYVSKIKNDFPRTKHNLMDLYPEKKEDTK